MVCDSADETVQQALRDSVQEASASRRERIAVVGGNGESAEKLVERAAQLNSERMVLVGPDALDSAGETISGVFMAAAVAGVIAANRDPAVPLNGAEVKGLGGVAQTYSDNEIDLLVRGGVTPMESVAGVLSPMRGITTRTTTGGGGEHHLAGADHHPDCGRRDPHRPHFAAQQVHPHQEYGPDPQRHPLPGDRGAGEQGKGGDHRRATASVTVTARRTTPPCAWWSLALPWPTASTRSI